MKNDINYLNDLDVNNKFEEIIYTLFNKVDYSILNKDFLGDFKLFLKELKMLKKKKN